MDFSSFIETAWNDHAADPRGVALRLRGAGPLVRDDAQIARLATLAHHLHGEHLGDWHGGIAAIERLAELPAFVSAGAGGQALRRCVASLMLSAGREPDGDGLAPADRIRIKAMAAANLAERDTGRAARLLQDALDAAERSGVDTDNAAVAAAAAVDGEVQRSLAISANNLACTLEDKPGRSAAERDLMIMAAQAARRCWERAGTWLEVERAEYRLAMSWLRAGEPRRARVHARACLDIVDANGGVAFERFFGCEALARVERAAGDAAAHAAALAAAREAFAALDDESDRAGCAACLEALAAPDTAVRQSGL